MMMMMMMSIFSCLLLAVTSWNHVTAAKALHHHLAVLFPPKCNLWPFRATNILNTSEYNTSLWPTSNIYQVFFHVEEKQESTKRWSEGHPNMCGQRKNVELGGRSFLFCSFVAPTAPHSQCTPKRLASKIGFKADSCTRMNKYIHRID